MKSNPLFVKYIIFILSVLFSLNSVFAQIYVKDNSFIFNKGTVVYAKGNLELGGANSNFYLRNEGQFLQGTVGVSANKGIGKLSVFQEGTVNNFAYNYWCSPVGNASAVSGNEDFGITMFTIPTSNTLSTAATISSATYNGSSSAGALTIASYWIFKFLSQSTYSGWVQSGALTDIAAGQGFTMKGTSGSDATNVGETTDNNPGSAQRYDFRGKPNDGDITITVANDNFTLTGNPYCSAIDLNLFLTDPLNNAIHSSALFWEHDKDVNSHNIAQYRGGYGVYNGSTSIYTPATFYTYDVAGNQGSVFSNPNNMYQRRFSPIGQGFMVRGAANGTVQMRNIYRLFRREGVANNSQFERNSNIVQTADYGFFDDIPNVAGIDYTQISKAPTPHFIVNTADMYLVLNNDLYVHSATSFDENKRFPIGFKNATSGMFTFTIKVNEFINFDVDNVFLHDLESGLYHDIKNSFYEVTLPSGVYNNRFEITFKNDALSVSNPIKENIVVFQNNMNQLLTVSNPNLLDIKSVTLFDISGKKIFSHLNLGTNSSYAFSTAALSDGVYLAKIQCSDGKNKVQKIIVSSN